ncbi:MAG TPA: cytochrome c [Chitinophagaceae bacterium]|nr:cytochrome c [Chitinophagaceae bacterium]
MKIRTTNKFLLLSVCSCFFIFYSCAIRKSEPITQRAFIAKNNRVSNGERIYMAHCQKCHPGGEGGLGPALNSNPAPQFIYRFQMRHGLGVMPAFKKDEISKRDLKDISKYLKAWKHH